MRRFPAILAAILLCLVPAGVREPSAGQAAHADSAPTRAFHLQQATRTEIVALRTQNSRTYLDGGRYLAEVSAGPVNYKDTGGQWQPIDNTLVPASNPAYAYQNRANSYTVDFPSDLGKAPVRIQLGDRFVEFSLAGAHAPISVSGNTASYDLGGTIVSYSADSGRVKETITLSGRSSPAAYTFKLSMSPGLTPTATSAGGLDIADQSQAHVFSLPAPTIGDHSHPVTPPGTVGMKLQTSSGVSQAVFTVDPAWLADPSRTWPVIVDPSVVIDGATGNQNYIRAGGTYNYTDLLVGDHDTSYCGAACRSLFKFPLPTIPTDATVLSAHFIVNTNAGSTITHGSVGLIGLYGVTRAWSAPTWTKATSITSWQNPGGDYDSTTGTTAGCCNFYPTTIVQEWINKTLANNGFLLKEVSENNNALLDLLPAGVISGYEPTLQIYYSEDTGEQDYYTFQDFPLTDQMSMSVNVANGNLVVDSTDLSMPETLPFAVERTYNSLDANPGTNYHFGIGWFGSAFDVSLKDCAYYTGGQSSDRCLYQPTGTPGVFASSGNGGYVSPAGIDAALVHNADGTYTLTYNETGELYKFDSTGHLLSDADAAGNRIAYNGQYVTPITDSQGRTTTVSIQSYGMVTSITDPASRTYQYAYSANYNAQLLTYTDPAGKQTHYEYNNSGSRLSKITDPNGNVTSIAMDSSGRTTSVTRVTNPSTGAGYTTTFAYSSGRTVVTDPNGHATTYNYDPYLRDTSAVDARSYTYQTSWTGDNHVQQSTVPSGAQTTSTFDANNNLTQVKLPTNATQTAQYANPGLPYDPTTLTDPQSHTTNIQYNSNQTVASVTDPLNHVATATYNANGTPATTTDPRNDQTSYGYTIHLIDRKTGGSIWEHGQGGAIVSETCDEMPGITRSLWATGVA